MDRKRLLDSIIDKYAEPYLKPQIEHVPPKAKHEHYVCTDNGESFVVAYDVAAQIAYYFFKDALVKDPLEFPISHEQRDYYVRKKIWSQDG
jgi:hypothetical protein